MRQPKPEDELLKRWHDFQRLSRENLHLSKAEKQRRHEQETAQRLREHLPPRFRRHVQESRLFLRWHTQPGGPWQPFSLVLRRARQWAAASRLAPVTRPALVWALRADGHRIRKVRGKDHGRVRIP